MFSDHQIIALSRSIEHWYEMCITVYSGGQEIPIGAAYCTCCNYFMLHMCRGCPISEYTGKAGCSGTPYVKCDKAAHNFNKDQKAFYDAAVEEYQFLIEVMCSKAPWENCDECS